MWSIAGTLVSVIWERQNNHKVIGRFINWYSLKKKQKRISRVAHENISTHSRMFSITLNNLLIKITKNRPLEWHTLLFQYTNMSSIGDHKTADLFSCFALSLCPKSKTLEMAVRVLEVGVQLYLIIWEPVCVGSLYQALQARTSIFQSKWKADVIYVHMFACLCMLMWLDRRKQECGGGHAH